MTDITDETGRFGDEDLGDLYADAEPSDDPDAVAEFTTEGGETFTFVPAAVWAELKEGAEQIAAEKGKIAAQEAEKRQKEAALASHLHALRNAGHDLTDRQQAIWSRLDTDELLDSDGEIRGGQ